MKFNEQQRQAQLEKDRQELAAKMAALDAKLSQSQPVVEPVIDQAQPAPAADSSAE